MPAHELTWEPSDASWHGIGAVHRCGLQEKVLRRCALNLLQVPSYTVYDAAVYWRQKKWDVTFNFKNLTNKTYYTVPTFIGALLGDPR